MIKKSLDILSFNDSNVSLVKGAQAPFLASSRPLHFPRTPI
jgi:hypothetical protein